MSIARKMVLNYARIASGFLLLSIINIAIAVNLNSPAKSNNASVLEQRIITELNKPSHDLIKKFKLSRTKWLHFAYRNTFVFNPRKLRWYAYGSNGRIIRSGRAVGGAGYCRDIKRSCRTPVGSFRVQRKGGPGCRSSRYPLGRGGAMMSYCMFFSKYYAIHGSNSLPGRNASHGCIRVSPSAARWLSHNFIRIGTRVVVLPY